MSQVYRASCILPGLGQVLSSSEPLCWEAGERRAWHSKCSPWTSSTGTLQSGDTLVWLLSQPAWLGPGFSLVTNQLCCCLFIGEIGRMMRGVPTLWVVLGRCEMLRGSLLDIFLSACDGFLPFNLAVWVIYVFF